MVDVSIVIVSYNTKNLTLKCIKSVEDEGSNLSREIIIVDNGSSDGSYDAIRNSKFQIPSSKLKIKRNQKNLGFSKANNQGIKKAEGKYILLLNSDTVVNRGAIGILVEFAEKTKDAGAVAPKLLNIDGSIQGSVFRLPTLERAIRQYWLALGNLLDKYYPEGKRAQEVEAAVMASFLITPKALSSVGLLDERYFMYYEDLDYCKRINKVGLKVYYLPAAEVVHYHGESGRKLINKKEQWKRLVPSSKIYHGLLKHYMFNFIIWSGQKWKKFGRK